MGPLQDFFHDISLCVAAAQNTGQTNVERRVSKETPVQGDGIYMAIVANMALSEDYALLPWKLQESVCSHPLRSPQWESSDGRQS